jgi:C-terminal processing protease CtpA/Prc
VVLAIDGEPVTNLGFDESIQLIRGPEGSTVVLTVRKANGTVVEVATPRHLIHT